MCPIRSSIVVLGLVLTGCSQPNLVFQTFPWEQADFYCIQGQPVYPTEKKDFCRSDRPLLFHDPKATFPVPILFDESAGTGRGYDRLYVDFDGDGNFLNDPVYEAPKERPALPEGFSGQVLAYFQNVHIVHNRQAQRFAHVQVLLYASGGAGGNALCMVVPQRWAVGTVRVGAKAVPAALIDRNWNDRFADPAGLNLQEYPDRFPRGDYLLLAIDGEDRIAPGSIAGLGRDGTARGILTDYLVLDGGTYRVRAQQLAGGVKLELVPADLPGGKVDLAARAGQRVLLIGTKTCVLLRGAPKEASVPADTYVAPLWESQMPVTVRPGQKAEAARPATPPASDDGLF